MIGFVNNVYEDIWRDRYSKDGESLSDNIRRVAKFCSKCKEDEESFYNVMANGYFFPAGRTMSNSGVGRNLTLNNCNVSPVIEDDLGDIFDKVKLGARTHQRGGGIGYSFSALRPSGAPTTNDAVASGPISFMDVFDAQTSTILSGNRRGANMSTLSVYHMDIKEFIDAKQKDPNRLKHFNMSVMVDDDFMNAVRNDLDIDLHHPVYDSNHKIQKDSAKWIYHKKVKARNIWDKMVRSAYNTGEPGILMGDTMNRDNPLWYIENIVCTNPSMAA